ncbi:nitroreductase [Actinoplanes sp. TBRC 11911]|uniref:Acg family FMN-binding oxidoreductase n=1 Tax=Actinoplanes sp. TBRC 11911 TaxID=2729386 RepID=UPI00145F6F7A|nr:nitroreductase family protein [Actinoplanes sp. TBRC 11911]NMO57293.1 nitroreductase [Actinoplanes sp. TBRC 11911]
MATTIGPPSRKVLADCVRSATAAPSLHNSQPWLFRVERASVEVYTDPRRRLEVIDPDGREQLISIGAALFTLRLAIEQAGYETRVTLFPAAEASHLVARATITGTAPVTAATEALSAAIPHRHTNRWPFAHTPVPQQALEQMRDAARREGAVLTVASAPARDRILALAMSADRWLRARPGYRDEIARWTGGVRHDGVPLWAVGPWDALETVPIRDFAELSELPRPTEKFEPYPTILILATEGDGHCDWVRAGQALQRVLLTATWQNLATTPISQPVEVPAVRQVLTDPDGGLSAQMVLRVGYGRVAPSTPRRPLTDVLRSAEDKLCGPGGGR